MYAFGKVCSVLYKLVRSHQPQIRVFFRYIYIYIFRHMCIYVYIYIFKYIFRFVIVTRAGMVKK